jgi:site-specific DNA-methyltransferase (adenine-specific)
MSLYYEDDHVTLYHGDCREVLAWVDADVLVTDPPYGTQFTAANPRGGYGRRYLYDQGDGLGATIAGDEGTTTRDAILDLWGDKPALVFGSPRLPDPPGHWDDRLVWDKRRPGMNGGAWRYTHESIYARGFVRTRNDSFSVLTAFPADQSLHIHAKPVALMEALIGNAPDGVIADPFAGSGSTLIAARNLGRKVIGVELEEKYCELIVRRLSQQAFDFTALEGGAA